MTSKTSLRAELQGIVDDLLAKHDGPIELDALGEAIGARAITSDEIDRMIGAIEDRGRTVATRAGGDGEKSLKRVLDAARQLRSELGRAPRPDEIAARAELSMVEVQHALSLARIMQR